MTAKVYFSLMSPVLQELPVAFLHSRTQSDRADRVVILQHRGGKTWRLLRVLKGFS